MVWYPLRVPNSKQGENLSAPVSPSILPIYIPSIWAWRREIVLHISDCLFTYLWYSSPPNYWLRRDILPTILSALNSSCHFFPLTYASKSQGLAPPGKGSVEGVMCWALLVLINMKTAGQLRVKDYRKGKYIGFTAPQYCTYSTYSECLVLYVFYN